MKPQLLLATLLLAGCATAPATGTARVASAVTAQARAFAAVATPPAALVARVLPAVQKESDKASERRDLEFFTLPANPLGIRFGTDGWVLSFLGTGKTDADVNVELRAIVSDAGTGVTMNYSGPTTLGRGTTTQMPLGLPDTAGTTFELVTGVPGNGVADRYMDYLEGLQGSLKQRWGAQPFQFDDGPIAFAVSRGGQLQGFAFTNQGNKLVLGERKYADVQNVAAFTADGELAAAYTIVAFNRKTAGPGAAPVFETSQEPRFGTMAVCGEI